MKILNFYFIFFFYFLLASVVSASNKIYYIDVDYIFKNSNKGKEIILNLDKINKNHRDELEKDKKTLLKLEKDINQKKNILNKEELNRQLNKLNLKVSKYNQKKELLDEKFKKTKKENINSFFSSIENIINDYMKEKKVDLLIDKKTILIGVSSLDATKEVLDIINKKLN